LIDWLACHLCGDPELEQICASLNHRKNINADPLADSSKALTVNREVKFIFLELMPVA